MIMIFKLKISGRGLTRISPATFQRGVRSPLPEKLDCPSISTRRCIFRRRPVTGDIWFYRQLGSGWLQVWGHALHTRDTLLRALTFREHETSFHHVEHHFDYVCATTTIAAKCKTRCPPRDVVRSRMPGHLATGIKNRSYISVRVYAKLFLGETATENPFYWMLLSARSLSHLRITALLNQFPYSRDNVVRGRQRERRKLNLSNERWYLIRPRERISKYA